MLSVDRPSTECRPITDRYIGQVSTNYRRSVGERKAISAETHLERLSTVSRPSVDRVSTECRPTIDRVSTAISTDISRSTLPTVNKIQRENNYRLGQEKYKPITDIDRHCLYLFSERRAFCIFFKLKTHQMIQRIDVLIDVHCYNHYQNHRSQT